MRRHAHAKRAARRERGRHRRGAGTTIVSGPGQNAAASRRSIAEPSPPCSACAEVGGDQRDRAAASRPLSANSLRPAGRPRIDGEPVERVGRIRDDAAAPEDLRRRGDRCRSGSRGSTADSASG